MKAEQRKHPRYKARNYGIDIFSRYSGVHGKLVNISLSGLAFRYNPLRSGKTQSDSVDIMATGPARFYLSDVPCRKIYDISALAEDQSFSGAETRLCGMEFVRIQAEEKLAFFLENFLIDSAESRSLI